jgi:hypothetical protein
MCFILFIYLSILGPLLASVLYSIFHFRFPFPLSLPVSHPNFASARVSRPPLRAYHGVITHSQGNMASYGALHNSPIPVVAASAMREYGHQ